MMNHIKVATYLHNKKKYQINFKIAHNLAKV